MSVVAYHWTPYEFDKFSLECVGTGMGDETEGHGIYFTSQNFLKRNQKEELRAITGKLQRIKVHLWEDIHPSFLRWNTQIYSTQHESIALQLEQEGVSTEALLDWDKKIQREFAKRLLITPSGKEVYTWLSEDFFDGSLSRTSEFCLRAGIRGIKCPTGNWRAYYYVVFDPDDIRIIGREEA